MPEHFDASAPPPRQREIAGLHEHREAPAEPGPSEFEVAWAEQTYSAASPSQKVFITMRGDTDIDVTFMPGWYSRAGTSEMEVELARAAKMTFVERTRAYYAVRSDLAGRRVQPATTIHSDEQARWRRGLEELPAHGESPDGAVAMTMVGMTHYSIAVAAGALSTMGETTFAGACRAAGLACLADHTRGWQKLHFDIYTRPRLERLGVVIP